MATNVFQCPTGCEDIEMTPTNFSDCAPEVNSSEIEKIFITQASSEPFKNWEEPTEWLARVSQTKVEKGTIRVLTVIADKPASASTSQELSNGRTRTTKKTNTVNYTIDDTSGENYDFAKMLECGSSWKFWYQTQGGYIYGGNAGIKVKGITVDPINERGRDAIETIAGTLTWESKTSFPDRVKSPIAETDFDATNGK